MMRRTLSAAVLVFALCCPVSAGVIHNPPPVPMTNTGDSAHLTDDAETARAETAEPGVSDGLTELTLELLAILPALF